MSCNVKLTSSLRQLSLTLRIVAFKSIKFNVSERELKTNAETIKPIDSFITLKKSDAYCVLLAHRFWVLCKD